MLTKKPGSVLGSEDTKMIKIKKYICLKGIVEIKISVVFLNVGDVMPNNFLIFYLIYQFRNRFYNDGKVWY